MDTLALSLSQGRHPSIYTVGISVNGNDLIDLVVSYERSRAEKGPFGYSPVFITTDRSHPEVENARPETTQARFMGRVDRPDLDPDRVVLLVCPACSQEDCVNLRGRVHTDDDSVKWSDFKRSRRAWDYSGFGPFVFDRRSYEAEIERAFDQLRGVGA